MSLCIVQLLSSCVLCTVQLLYSCVTLYCTTTVLMSLCTVHTTTVLMSLCTVQLLSSSVTLYCTTTVLMSLCTVHTTTVLMCTLYCMYSSFNCTLYCTVTCYWNLGTFDRPPWHLSRLRIVPNVNCLGDLLYLSHPCNVCIVVGTVLQGLVSFQIVQTMCVCRLSPSKECLTLHYDPCWQSCKASVHWRLP